MSGAFGDGMTMVPALLDHGSYLVRDERYDLGRKEQGVESGTKVLPCSVPTTPRQRTLTYGGCSLTQSTYSFIQEASLKVSHVSSLGQDPGGDLGQWTGHLGHQ